MKKLLVVAAVAMSSSYAWAEAPADAVVDTTQASFTQIDANQDGMISKEEASSFSSVELMFDKADSNKDGALDSTEFEQAAPAEAAAATEAATEAAAETAAK
ncbi:MAG TPA: EF-hand domain-containing protein [Gammaproteobacteria bacterium]|nr:EF-hand domain-containing protein [Gammaproteobacteria bacterium]